MNTNIAPMSTQNPWARVGMDMGTQCRALVVMGYENIQKYIILGYDCYKINIMIIHLHNNENIRNNRWFPVFL